MRLILVRHGESVSNAHPEAVTLPEEEGDRLTDRGREQARAAAEPLRDAGAGRLLSSPMGRARETAEIIAEGTGLGVEAEELIHELRESRDYGRLAPEEQKLRRWSMWMAEHGDDPDYSYNGGESFNQVLGRVRAFQRRLSEKEQPDCVIAVTHGIFSRFFLFWTLLGEDFRVSDVQRLWKLRSRNGGVSTFELAERHHPADPEVEGWSCVSWMERPWARP